MSGKFFLDTNIFVYSFDQTAPHKSERSAELIRQALATQKGVISFQVVQEFFNVALRRFAHPMNASDAEQYFTVTLRPLLAVHSSPALYLEALRLQSRYRLSWYDSLIIAAAMQAECEVLLTEDLQDGQKIGDLRIEDPFRPTGV
jgi:predicted nucleic acid-binding protein